MKIALLTTDKREFDCAYGVEIPYFGTPQEALLEGFRKLDGIEVHVVSCSRVPMAAPFSLGDNIRYHQAVVPRLGWAKTGFLGCIRATRRILYSIQPDIVHGQGTERDCAMAAVHSGYPNVLTIHGNMAEIHRLGFTTYRWYSALISRLETHALARTAGTLCNSQYTEDLVRLRSPRTWRVPNPIESAFLESPLPESDPPSEIPILACIGVISARKRQVELLNLFRRLHGEGHRFKVVFAGAINTQIAYSNEFLKAIEAVGPADYAEFVGELERPELLALFNRARACVHFPSEEAFGLVVVESLGRGLSFFGADVGGIRDIAQGVPGAALFGDVDRLGTAIAAWLGKGAPRNHAAAAIMTERYHPVQIARRHVEIYREVLGPQEAADHS